MSVTDQRPSHSRAIARSLKVLALATVMLFTAGSMLPANAVSPSTAVASVSLNTVTATAKSASKTVTKKTAPRVSASYPYGGGSRITVNSSTAKNRKVTLAKGATSLQVQRYDTAKRKWIASSYLSPTRQFSTKTEFTLPMLKFSDGSTHQFRLHVPHQKTVSSWTGKTQTVTWPKSSTKIGAGFFEKLTVVSSATGLESPIFVGGQIGRTVYLQQKVNGTWRTKDSAKTSSKGLVDLQLPKASHNTKASFRVYAPSTRTNNAATGKTVTVKYNDPKKSTGLAKEVYGYTKKMCPNTAITLAPKAKYKGWAGSAYPAENRIVIYEKMNRNRSDWKNFINYIATHECSHLLISKAAKRANVTDVRGPLNKLFKTSGSQGVERMADAVSTQWRGGKTNNNYYTKNFTKAQKNAAKKILAGRWY